MKYNIDIEDFISWAKQNKEDYYELYDAHINDALADNSEFEEYSNYDADEFITMCAEDVEVGQDIFEEVILMVIEDLEDDDYFGTEGFNKRFQ